MTERLTPNASGLSRAATILREGGLVAFPTETVYGLGADAMSAAAVAGVFEVKGRPHQNPLIVHLRLLDDVANDIEVTPLVEKLARRWWPGPLTLVVRRGNSCALPASVSGGAHTVALRSPDHSVTRELLKRFGGPLVGPSANVSGHVSATTATHVMDDLQGRIAAVIDGGACRVGLESTIVDCTQDRPMVLRQGVVGRNELAATAGQTFALLETDSGRSPGSFASHYAPRAAVRLNANAPRGAEAWLGFGATGTVATSATIALNLSPRGELSEAAHNLYAYLRQLDDRLAGTGTIAVSPIPETGLGACINDRLRRAAAPRPS